MLDWLLFKELNKNCLKNLIKLIKKGQNRNPAPFKIQYPMKNRCKNTVSFETTKIIGINFYQHIGVTT
jgi:hypothetical protein